MVDGADQADLDYVRILHLAASDGEECVRIVLAALLLLPAHTAARTGSRARMHASARWAVVSAANRC